MAILMISAELPCTGAFMAMRSAASLTIRLAELTSGRNRRLPKTVFTNYSKDVAAVVKSVGGAPCIIKLLEGTQGIGVVLADTEKSAIAVIEAFNSLKARVIVQEYIREARGADIRAFVERAVPQLAGDGKASIARLALDGRTIAAIILHVPALLLRARLGMVRRTPASDRRH